MEKMDKSMLFTPVSFPHLTLPTRLVRSATELFCANPDGTTIPFEFETFETLGRQPLGMIVTGHTCVSPEGRSNRWQNAIWSDDFLPDAEKIASLSRAHGARAVMQLGHGGMKAEGNNGGLRVLTPDTMTPDEIHSVVKAFGKAALRAKTAGFDGVMLHGAHLYLLSQFFYPAFNHRSDAYGGCGENRFRIIREALEEVKLTCGTDYPVFLKINGDDEGNTEDYHRDLVTVLNLARQSGLEAAEISGWNSALPYIPEKPYFIDNIRRLKTETELPLIEVGGIRSTEDMLDALEAGASAVSMSRPLICEPDLPEKIRDDDDTVSCCVGCGFCYRPYPDTKPRRCSLHRGQL